jgi:hypothetical protein
MQSAINFSSLRPSGSGMDSSFNVVIAYEDFETGKHAKRTYDFLVEHLGEECQFNNQMWKFDVLAVPRLREMAAKDAAQADIIIVAAHGGNELPVEVHSWIESWLMEQTRAIALVGLFDTSEIRENPASSYLSKIAKRAGMEYFGQPGLWPEGGPTNDSDMNERTFSALTGMVQLDRDISHWGINE